MSATLEPTAPPAPATPDPPVEPGARARDRRIGWRSWPPSRRFLAVLLVAYVAKAFVMVFLFPAFSGHDEVAHYSYLRVLATEGRVPVLPDVEEWRAIYNERRVISPFDGMPDELYPFCRYTLYWNCQPTKPQWMASPPRAELFLNVAYPTGYIYVANHPPLYYALMTPIYWLTSALSAIDQQYVLRLAAIPFGIATVVLAYLLALTLFPGDAFLAVLTPALVAFQTQVSYEAAMVNNDIVTVALFSWLTLLLARGVRNGFPRRTCLWIGFVLGLSLLTKSNSLFAIPIIAFAIILTVGWRNWRAWVERGALAAAPAAVMVAPWYAYMVRTYGNFDAFSQLQGLQRYWNHPEGGFLALLTDPNFAVMRFRETWGEFGWRMIPLDSGLLWLIALPSIAAIVGLYLYFARIGRDAMAAPGDPVEHPMPWQSKSLAVLIAACVVAYLAVVQFGTQFELTQARYFFPVVNAGALLALLGLRTLLPRAARPVAQGVVVAALALLTFVVFTEYVLPFHLSIVEEPGYGYFTGYSGPTFGQPGS